MRRLVFISSPLGGMLGWCCILCLLGSARLATLPTMTLVGQRNRSVALGHSISFECRYTSDEAPGVEYEWRYWEPCSTGQKPSYLPKLVVQGRRPEYLFNASYSFAPTIPPGGRLAGLLGTGVVSLTIVNTSAVFAATNCPVVLFVCVAVNQFSYEASDEVLVNLYDPAHITAASSVLLTVDELSAVKLPCEAAGMPAPATLWTKAVDGRQSVLPSGGYSFAGQLPSFVASVQSAGVYTCFAHNDYGNASKTVEVVIRYRPKVDAVRPRVAQAVGYYASLVCTATSGEPVTAAWWQHNGRVVARWSDAAAAGVAGTSGNVGDAEQVVNATDHDRLILKKPTVSGLLCILELQLGVMHSDYQQVYTCHFANSVGASSAAVELIASSKPRPTYGDGSVKPYRGETSSSAILRASLLLLLLGFLLHDLF